MVRDNFEEAMNILAIETSCDETAIAAVKAEGGLRNPRFKVLKNLVASQIETHRPFGGVVPNLAKREHQKNLPILWRRIMNNESRIKGKERAIIHNSKFIIPDLVAVTVGPGLEPCLWTGIEFAKNLAKELKKPLVGVNHLEGHIYSSLLLSSHPEQREGSLRDSSSRLRGIQNDGRVKFPAIILLVSGGHTILLKMKSLTQWEKLGETRDDAAGEAFDKVARLLGLPYPGGPEIAKLALSGDCKAIPFPQPMRDQENYDFSFSGLKTAVLYYLRDNLSKKSKNSSGYTLVASGLQLADVAASFEKSVTDVLTYKTMRAVKEFKAKSVLLCGGVAANRALRDNLRLATKNLQLNFFVPDFEFNTDNAAMIAAAAYLGKISRKKHYKLEANANLNL